MKTLYDLLAVSPDADAKALKIPFRRAAKANHPDLHPEDPRVLPKFVQIVAANSILSDAVQRAAYDQSLKYHQSLKLERQRLRLEERRLLILEGRGLLIGTAIVLTVIVVGAHWIYRNSQTIVTAINSNPRAARIEIVAADVGAETIGNGPYEGRNDGANFSTPAIDGAPAFANLWLASGLETMVAAPGANYDRNQPVVDAGTVINLPQAPAVSALPTKPQSVLTRASLPPVATSSGAQNSLDTLPARATSWQLTIDAIRLRQGDALLTISAGDVGSDAAVVVGGLAPGSTLSAGVPAGPNMWRLATKDLGDVVLAPPLGFVGAMDLRLELRLGDQTAVDRKAVQLEWSARDTLATPKSQRFGAAEIALMIEKGAALIGIGNVAGARMVLQHAAKAGDPAAAFALAETYDPLVLQRLDVKGGITSDIALANIWYARAKDLGSIMASERLKRLAGLAK
jgi:hypothetical protein